MNLKVEQLCLHGGGRRRGQDGRAEERRKARLRAARGHRPGRIWGCTARPEQPAHSQSIAQAQPVPGCKTPSTAQARHGQLAGYPQFSPGPRPGDISYPPGHRPASAMGRCGTPGPAGPARRTGRQNLRSKPERPYGQPRVKMGQSRARGLLSGQGTRDRQWLATRQGLGRTRRTLRRRARQMPRSHGELRSPGPTHGTLGREPVARSHGSLASPQT